MNTLARELARVAQCPTDERLRGLKRIIPARTVQAALRHTGRKDRGGLRLPSWFLVWFVIGLGLFASDCYRQVFRWLQPYRRYGVPPRSTLCVARQRLGCAPLRWLARHLIRLLGTPATPGAYYRDLRLMGLDGFVMDLPDTPANVRAFGRPAGSRAAGAFPQARLVALCELGTHVLWRWLVKPLRRGETALARGLLKFLEAGMLLLWDRNFLSYDAVTAVGRQGAFLLGRLKKHQVFRTRRRFRDGSFLAKLYRSSWYRQHDRGGVVVRIMEYTLRDPGRPAGYEKHRLLTTLLDATRDPADTLIALYHERWEEELALDELKTHLQQRPVLRSETPAGVVQELYGLLLGHYVVRVLMAEAAARQGLSPRRLSFTGALKILRCRWPACPAPARQVRRWYENLLDEIGAEGVEARRDRVNPRVVKRKMAKWKKKRPEHRHYPQPTMKFRDSIVMIH